MIAITAAKIMKTFSECPICDEPIKVNDLVITEESIILNCRHCGWGLYTNEKSVSLKFEKLKKEGKS